MQRRLRLTASRRFSEIHRDGASAANRLLVVRFLANGLDCPRFGFVVSKRIGNAVVRNRVKRRLREVVRRYPVKTGWDAVFIARRGIERATFQQLNDAAGGLLRRTQLVDRAAQDSEPGPGSGSPSESSPSESRPSESSQ